MSDIEQSFLSASVCIFLKIFLKLYWFVALVDFFKALDHRQFSSHNPIYMQNEIPNWIFLKLYKMH